MFSHRKLLLDNIGGQNKLNKKEIQKNKTESRTQFHIFMQVTRQVKRS